MVRNASSSTSTAMDVGRYSLSNDDAAEEEEDDDLVLVSPGNPASFYPSYSMGPVECLLVFLLFLLWCYAVRRFYTVWSNVLNFSATETLAHGIGWDAFFQWAIEHFRSIRNTRLSSSLGGSRVNNSCNRDQEEEEGQELSAVIKSNVSLPRSSPSVPAGMDDDDDDNERRPRSLLSSASSSSAVVVTTNYESGGKMTSDV